MKDRYQPQRGRFSLVNILFLGFLILGLGCTCLALVRIQAQSVSNDYIVESRSGSTPEANSSAGAARGSLLSTFPFMVDVDQDQSTNKEVLSDVITADRENADSKGINNNTDKTEGGEDRIVFAASGKPKVLSTEGEVLYPVRPDEGDPIGSLIIPALKQKMAIIHGADEEELEKGVGHFTGSVLPGENNNTVLSGHRDTVFTQLGKLKLGDKLITVTSAGRFTYEIIKGQIVEKDDKTIIVPTDQAVLTVTTCYPFRYIGNAPKRYILTAVLVERE